MDGNPGSSACRPNSHLKGASDALEGEGVAPGLQPARRDLEVLADVVGVQHHFRAGRVLRHVRERPPVLNDCNDNILLLHSVN